MRQFLRQQSGLVSVQNLLFFLMFIGVGGIAIDVTNAYRMRSIMQATSDSAALSAAVELPNAAQATSVAEQFVEYNMPASQFGTLTEAEDIVFGTWDADARVFTENPGSPNAVVVTLSRTRTKNNALPLALLGVVGIDYWNIETRAMAIAEQGCTGIIANNMVEMGQDVRVASGVCVYGRNGIEFGQDAFVAADARIGTLPPFNLKTGQSPRISDGSKFTGDQLPPRALRVPEIIDDWQVRGYRDYYVQVVSKLPSKLINGTLYIVNGNVKINQDYSTMNVIIAARGDVSWGQDGAIRNTLDCVNDRAIGIYATGDISFGQDAVLEGVDLVAAGNINIGQDVRSMQATLEAGNDVRIAQDPHFTTCKPLEETRRLAGLRH